ncbi:glycosyltransferase family 4 protein [Tellurirhabdus bombi]|uniref:glycosyltransferase family 4 protein n=1 Tax=Tellurirhabdus bombi TaxID=2907205 RepID=UPI001F422C26|nr:glycosyltransferase [Tellurirhabdus bombi]
MENVKKKILIFIERFTPSYKSGGPVRSIESLIPILNKYYNVFIVTRDRDAGDKEAFKDIKIDEWIKKDNYTILYLSPSSVTISRFYKILCSIKYDFIYTNSLMSEFTRYLFLNNFLLRNKIIVAPRGELHSGALSIKKDKKKPYIWFVKKFILEKIIWHATDYVEKVSISQLFGNRDIRLAPDTTSLLAPRKYYQKRSDQVSFVYISRITQKKGLIYFLELLKNDFNGVITFDIFGPIDEAYWKECQAIISKKASKCIITYKGTIAHELINEVLHKYDFFVLPTFGENFGHAIIEAMSAGVPVLISDQTQWKNLAPINAGWDISLGQKEKWIDIVQFCITVSNEEYQKISKNAVGVAENYIKSVNFEKEYLELFN